MTSKRSLLALSLALGAHAVSFTFKNTGTTGGLLSSPLLAGGGAKPVGDGPFEFSNSMNFSRGNLNVYVATLQMSGTEYVVHMDTGSSDLWLDTAGNDITGIPNTNINSGIRYVDGTSAAGPVLIGDLTFGDFQVSQAFISAPGSNATTNGNSGLMGVGPPRLSAISDDLASTDFNGKTVLENIFDAHPDEPHIITFDLSRSQTMGLTDGGTFTIGEVEPSLTNVTNQPRLEVLSTSSWTVFLDGIEVNGRVVNGGSQFSVTGQTPEQTLANLDTGTSLAFIPQTYLDAIYEDVPGAFFSAPDGVYIVPCDTVIEVAFIFGGQRYPVHPIDTVQATLGVRGDILCYSGFLPNDFDLDEDFLIGDTFLRNAYSLYSFGSFISGTETPYAQLLSTTDPSAARAEFAAESALRNATLNDVRDGGDGDPSNGGSNANGNNGSGSDRNDQGASDNGALGMRPAAWMALLGMLAAVWAL